MNDDETTPTTDQTDRIERQDERPATRRPRRGLLLGGIIAASLGVIALTAGVTAAIVDEIADDRDDVAVSAVADDRRGDDRNPIDDDGARTDDVVAQPNGALDTDTIDRAIAAAVEATGGDVVDVELSDDATHRYEVTLLVDGVETEVELDGDFAVVEIDRD